MKKIKAIACIFLFALFASSLTSCLVVATGGTPRGWNKNTNNPHNQNSTNPGRGNKH